MSFNAFTLTTDSVILKLPMPNFGGGVDGDVTNNLSVFDMWIDAVEVNHLGLDQEPLNLDGVITETFCDSYATDLSGTVELIWSMQNDGDEITINDLSDSYNGIYIIQRFGLKTIKKTIGFSYHLSLQKVRDI